MEKEPLTEYGYTKLIAELKDLKEVQKPHILKEVEIARQLGDLKENAEYHSAKDTQRFIESRIAELSDMLTKVQIVDPTVLQHNKVSFGSSVTLLDENDEEVTYTIVGAYESNPNRGYISFNSPFAKQLIGRGEGDELTMKLPSGEKEYEIKRIFFKEITFGE